VYNLQTITPYDILGSNTGVCVTSPVVGLTWHQALLIEAITTGVLILLVCAVWDPRSGNGDCGSLKFLVMIFFTSVIVVSIYKLIGSKYVFFFFFVINSFIKKVCVQFVYLSNNEF